MKSNSLINGGIGLADGAQNIDLPLNDRRRKKTPFEAQNEHRFVFDLHITLDKPKSNRYACMNENYRTNFECTDDGIEHA